MKRVFISFDNDHDAGVKTLLVGQSKNPDTPFNITDYSIKEAITTGWKIHARTRIKSCDLVIVLCGEYTNTAEGVSQELLIAQEEQIPYVLLAAYPDKPCRKPIKAKDNDKIYRWTWDNLKALINGAR